MIKNRQISGSYKDPSGTVYSDISGIYRVVNMSYRANYDLLVNSGLYKILTEKHYLIPHEEIDLPELKDKNTYKILKPITIPHISYPYDWSFSMMKDAALLTLKIQSLALQKSMSLKDSSAYNVQFMNNRPVFIDTLSFEKYKENLPWIAYHQFCKQFLAPLALMAYSNLDLNKMLYVYPDGIPVDITSKLLPLSSYLNINILIHIHLHARTKNHYAESSEKETVTKFPLKSLCDLVDNLQSTINGLRMKNIITEWSHYYDRTNYSPAAFEDKKRIFTKFLDMAKPRRIWDIGANTGVFSKIAAEMGIFTVAMDIDPAVVENLYQDCRKNDIKNILPLVIDITNPTPGLGWENKERFSLLEHEPVDLVSALALVHHLAISHNLPLEKIADFFHKICRFLIIEFIPKNDSQVQKLLKTREDIFSGYEKIHFEECFSRHFSLHRMIPVRDSYRIMYLYKNNKL